VRRIYGFPGDGINGVFGALQRAKGKIEFVRVRHEEMAAFMASAHAKFTGELGVCIATSGPGAAHLITGLYDARLDHMPVLAIAGQSARSAIGGHYQQEVDIPAMYKDVPGASVQTAMVPAQVRHLVDRSVRIALGERRVTALVLPNDIQDLSYEDPPRTHNTLHSGVGYDQPKTVPYERELKRAADVLNAGKKVGILVGAGALHATDEVIAVADKLGAGVAKALLGKAALPDDLPWVTGSIGLLGTKRGRHHSRHRARGAGLDPPREGLSNDRKDRAITAGEAPIGRVAACAFEIPTDAPEADGTFAWDSTALVLAEIAAERFAAQQVTWFEEPVSSDDLGGLALVRERAPEGLARSALAPRRARAAMCG
jgi:hypothetical protein